MKIYVRGINTCPQNGISLVKYSLQFKATLSRWQNLKKSGWLFQVRILSSWFYHNDKTFFQLHCNGIVTFIKTGPVFVGFCCCKMCFCTLAFLKRCLWQCPFKAEHKIIKLTICKKYCHSLLFRLHSMKAATKFKVFCIRYFSKTKRKPAKKKPKQCISSKTKSTCQNSTTSEHFQKWLKNQGVVLALSLSIVQ